MIEKKVYDENCSASEQLEIRKRVSFNKMNGIVIIDELPIISEFSAGLIAEEVASIFKRTNEPLIIIGDLTDSQPPSTGATKRLREMILGFDRENRVSHIYIFGVGALLKAIAKFIFKVALKNAKFSICNTYEEVMQQIKESKLVEIPN